MQNSFRKKALPRISGIVQLIRQNVSDTSLGPLNTMSVASSLMLAALTLIAFALPLAGYILVKERTLNFQKVWTLAVVGRRPARLYVAVVLVAFALAVVGWFFALADHRAEKRVGAAAPNLARQPTTFGRS